jgi:hypothetical protein
LVADYPRKCQSTISYAKKTDENKVINLIDTICFIGREICLSKLNPHFSLDVLNGRLGIRTLATPLNDEAVNSKQYASFSLLLHLLVVYAGVKNEHQIAGNRIDHQQIEVLNMKITNCSEIIIWRYSAIKKI